MKLQTRQNGFTLIELLVVIAIIGVLSAVVLASLSTARDKGNDAGVKSNLGSVQTQAAIFDSDRRTYGTFDNGSGAATACPTPGTSGTSFFHDVTVENAIASALKDGGTGGTAMCLATDTNYAVAVTRPSSATSSPSTYWCIDSAQNHCGVNDNSLTGTSCGTCVTTN